MNRFTYQALGGRVVFGPGSTATLAQEVQRLGARRALVLCSPEQQALAETLARSLGEQSAGVFAQAAMHVPIEIARRARQAASDCGADCAVAVGGGSAIGLGKAIALESALPIVAVPTTYAGSEMTPIYGLTEGNEKRTGRDPRVLPRVAIYDPELTLSLPPAFSVTSGLNAMAHAAEGLYAQDANPITGLMAEEGLRALARSLPVLAGQGADIAARSDALYGAWLCGSVLGSVGMALHHKLCHTLGGSFQLPHAEVHAVVLPYALAFNAPAAPQAAARGAAALGAPGHSAGSALQALARRCGAPDSLAQIGLRAADLDSAAELACRNPYWNPRPFDRRAIRELLQAAFDGAACP